MKRQSILGLVAMLILSLCNEHARASLTQIDGWVYRTGSGTSSLYWYLDMSDLVNHTWDYQQFYASGLELNIEGIEDDWHIATEQEVEQLLVLNGNSAQNQEVKDILGPSPIQDRWYCRYDEISPFPGVTDHYQTKLHADGYVYTLISANDNDEWSHLGAWIVTESAPYIRAEADGPYVIGFGESVFLDSSGSYSNWGLLDEFRWRIDGQDVGTTVSYDALVGELGLSPGTYTVELRAGGGGVYDYDYTTIEIVPEPTCWDANECAGQPYGDATCDGMINLADLYALKAHHGKCAPWQIGECCADFTQSGCVGLDDIFTLKANFGTSGYTPATGNQTCPP
jgi:hypothetical protein